MLSPCCQSPCSLYFCYEGTIGHCRVKQHHSVTERRHFIRTNKESIRHMLLHWVYEIVDELCTIESAKQAVCLLLLSLTFCLCSKWTVFKLSETPPHQFWALNLPRYSRVKIAAWKAVKCKYELCCCSLNGVELCFLHLLSHLRRAGVGTSVCKGGEILRV